MGIFSSPNLFDADIERVTDEKNTGEDWGAILDICDKVKAVTTGPKDCLKAILRRLNNSDPHVALQAVTVLDACVKNCGKDFHLEVASREFENEFRRLVQKGHPKVSENLRILLKKWVSNEFSSDSQLSLIPSLFKSLKAEGYTFSEEPQSTKKTTLSKDPNVASNEQEEEDLAKAIELSLKEAQKSPSTRSLATSSSSSLYPSTNLLTSSQASQPIVKKQARALYDFEAAEDNELTFLAGEIVNVIDDSDPNWWKGTNQRGEGLFPANFVTTDLNGDDEGAHTSLSSEKKEEVKTQPEEPQTVEIDEEKIDRLLRLLHDADPEGEVADPPELTGLEAQVNRMAPLIDAELDRIDRKHFALTKLNSELVEALNMYHSLMRESPAHAMYSNYQKPMPPVGPIHSPYFGGHPEQHPPHHGGVMYGAHPGSYLPGMPGATHAPEALPPHYGVHNLSHQEAPLQYHSHPGIPAHHHSAPDTAPQHQGPWMQQPFSQPQ